MPATRHAVYDNKRSFYAEKSVDLSPCENDRYTLHTHNFDELYIFIRGNSTFVVEGVFYANLKPYDIVLIKNSEFHCVKHNGSNTSYERIVLNLKDEFYSKNDCEVFRDVFSKKPRGLNSLIPSDLVKSSEIFDSIIKLEKYLKEPPEYSDVMVNCAIIEILYSISKLSTPPADYKSDIIKQIIDYINENLCSRIALDDIANHFFISKCHLCRIFKNSTGLTITQYITSKRIHLAEDLFKNGKSITDACLEAGFGSYTNFYKAYTKEKGVNPKTGLNINF